MTTVSYPEGRPFPYQGTQTAEGRAPDGGAPTAGPNRLPTLDRDGISALTQAADRFLDDCKESIRRQGRIAAIHGEHGAGKTHAIIYVMEHVRQRAKAGEGSVAKVVQLYGKVEGPDLIELYGRLMAQVPLPLFRELGEVYRGVLASEELVANLDQDEAIDQEAVKKLRSDPMEVRSAFDRYQVAETAVRERQVEEIDRVTGGIRDFRRVFPFIFDADATLSRAAHSWITGRPIDETASRRLGVSGPITESNVARYGIVLLATIFGRVGRPLILYLDQIEGFVLDSAGEPPKENLGLLRSLVELVPRELGMLVVSGNEESWLSYPVDLRQRIGNAHIFFPALRLDEAELMIGLYLSFARKPEDLSPATVGPLSPFTRESIRELLRFGGGNVRRFLQNAYDVFDAAEPDHRLIDAEFARVTLSRDSPSSIDVETAFRQVEQVLRLHGLSPVRSYVIGGVEVDSAVLFPDGSPQLVIKISEAIFLRDEAQTALTHLEVIRQAKSASHITQVALVVVGYASPEVTGYLNTVADWVIVFEPSSFEAEFRKTLTNLPAQTAPVLPPVQPDKLEERISEVQAALKVLLADRERKVSGLDTGVGEILLGQQSQRMAERRDEMRRAWVEARRRKQDEIRVARTRRATDELAELERLREAAERTRRNTMTLRALVGGGVIVAMDLVVLVSLSVGTGPALVGALVGVALVASGIAGVRILEPRKIRELAQPVSSMAELDRLAGADTRRRDLSDPNPHLRYACARSFRIPEMGTAKDLLQAVRGERSAIVRRAIVLNNYLLADRYAVEELLLRDREWPAELAYVIERTALFQNLPTPWRGPQGLEALAQLAESRSSGKQTADGVRFFLDPERSDVNLLEEAFRGGLDRIDPDATLPITEREVRGALRLLSPMDDGGLGTYDHLELISDIDELYLFFEHLLFYLEGGVLTSSTS